MNFPTRVANNKGTLIDSFFLDIVKCNSITAHPLENGLSNLDAQIVILDNLNISLHKMAPKKKVWLINGQTLNNFQSMVWEEIWDTICNTNNVNKIFNNFQCILLRNIENSYPAIYIGNRPKDNNWITKSIIT